MTHTRVKMPLYCYTGPDQSEWDAKDRLIASILEHVRDVDRGLAWRLVRERVGWGNEDSTTFVCQMMGSAHQLEFRFECENGVALTINIREWSRSTDLPVARQDRPARTVLSRVIELSHPDSFDVIREIVLRFLELDPKSGWR